MARRKRRTTGIAYLVKNKFWTTLPDVIRRSVFAGFQEAYYINRKSYMKLISVDPQNIPTSIDFVDAVAQIYPSQNTATNGLINTVRSQILQIKDYHINLPSSFLERAIDVGRTFTLKDPLGRAPYVVCVTESAISYTEALGAWRNDTKSHRRSESHWNAAQVQAQERLVTDEKWINKAPKTWQEWFGICLGRIVAHEVWHQIFSMIIDPKRTTRKKPVYGTDHPYSRRYYGLEDEGGGKYWHERDPRMLFSPIGVRWIKRSLPKLDRIQGNRPSFPLVRRTSTGPS